jgi:serine/threonine-protein kinase HipA
MTVARECGIEAQTPWIETFTGENGSREALLQHRFDRRLADAQIYRDAYASGFTILNLSTGVEDIASYTALAHELARWCARTADRTHAGRQRQELWRRIVFNALIGNVDDHTRNIAVLRRDGVWSLAPAFDLIPFDRSPRQPLASRMAYDRTGKLHRLSPQELIDAASVYRWSEQDAAAELKRMAAIVAKRFEPALRQWEVPDAEIRVRMTAIGMALDIVAAQGAEALHGLS